MKQLHLTRTDSLSAKPVRNPLVGTRIDANGELVLSVPMKRNLKTRLISTFFLVPKNREIILDETGRRIWEKCNGKNTVIQMIESLIADYKLNRKEAEVSLIEYLRMLSSRGLVALEIEQKK